MGWHLTCFGDPRAFQVELAEAPKEVDSVVNCRVFNRVTIVAGVSGGVLAAPMAFFTRQAMGVEHNSALDNRRSEASPPPRPTRRPKPADDSWWWD